MEEKKRSIPNSRRSKSTSSLPTILEQDVQPTGQNCIHDDQASKLLTYESKEKEEFLMKESKSFKPGGVRESRKRNGKISVQRIVDENQLNGSSGRSPVLPQENISRSFGRHQNLKKYDKMNDPLHSITVDLSNGKTLAEYLRIDEIVSSTVSKHLDKLVSLLGIEKTDGSNLEGSKSRSVQDSNLFEYLRRTRPVSHSKIVDDEDGWNKGEDKSLTSTLDYVPTRDRMSALAQKYLSSSGEGAGEGVGAVEKRDQIVQSKNAIVNQPLREIGKQNSSPVDFDSSHPALDGPVLERHCWAAKSDLQGVRPETFMETATYRNYEGRINGLLTSPPDGINSANIDSKTSSQPLIDINANFNEYHVISSGKKEQIQNLESSPPAEIEMHTNEGKKVWVNNPPSTIPQNISNTTIQPTYSVPVPVVPCAPGIIPQGQWRVSESFEQNLCQQPPRSNNGYTISGQFEIPLPSKFESVRFAETSSMVHNSTNTPEKYRIEKISTAEKNVVCHVGKSTSVMITGKSAVQNECCKSKHRFSENTSTIKLTGKSAVRDECRLSKDECSRNIADEAIDQRSKTQSIRCKKTQNSILHNEQIKKSTNMKDRSYHESKPGDPKNRDSHRMETESSSDLLARQGCDKEAIDDVIIKDSLTLTVKSKNGVKNPSMSSVPNHTHGKGNGNNTTNVRRKRHRSLPSFTRKSTSADNEVITVTSHTSSSKSSASVDCFGKLSHPINDLPRNQSTPCSESTGPSKIQKSRYQPKTWESGNCPTDDSWTKSSSFAPANDCPAELRISPSSRSLKVLTTSPSPPSSPSNNAEGGSFFGNIEAVKKSSSATPEFLEKYRTGLFCDQNYTKEKLRTSSRKKDPPRNQPVVVSPRSGTFSLSTNAPQKQSCPVSTSKKAAVSGTPLKRSVSLNDISMKHPTKDSSVSFKANSEKIRELSSSLESLFNKVSDISKNALMRNKKSRNESIEFQKVERVSSLESLYNRPWKSMNSLLTPDDPCNRPSYIMCRHEEAENDKFNSRKGEKETPKQISSRMMTLTEDNGMLQHEVAARCNTRELEMNDLVSNPSDRIGSNYSQRNNSGWGNSTQRSLVETYESSDTPVRDETIRTTGSLRKSESSRKSVPNRFSETPETLRKLDSTQTSRHREIMRPQSSEPLRQNEITQELGASRTFESSRIPGQNDIIRESRTSESDRYRKSEIIRVSGISTISEWSGTPERNEVKGVSRTSESPDRTDKNEVIGESGTSRTPEPSGKPGRIKEIPISKRTSESSYRPKRNETITESGTSKTVESPEIPGRMRTLKTRKTACTTGSLESLAKYERINEGASRSKGASRTSGHLCDSIIKKTKHKSAGKERRSEKICTGVKNCPERSSFFRIGDNQEMKLSEKLGKSSSSETTYLCEITENSTVRAHGSDNPNSQWKGHLSSENYENVLAEPPKVLEATTFSLEETQGSDQVSKHCSSDALNHMNANYPFQLMKPEKICKSDISVSSDSTTKNKNETRHRRKGVFEAPEVLRTRLYSQEDVNRLKMCFLSVQRQNNGLAQWSLHQNVCGPPETEICSEEPREEHREFDQCVLEKVLQLVHDEFAFDGYLNDGVEDVKMAEFIISRASDTECDFKNAVRKNYKDLYWEDKLMASMYEVVHGGIPSPAKMSKLQIAEETQQSSYEEPPTVKSHSSAAMADNSTAHSVSRSGSERSNSSGEGCAAPLSDQKLDFPEVITFGLDEIGDFKRDLTTIFNDYLRSIGVFLATTVNVLAEKLPVKIKEVQQQINLERRLKRRSWKAYLKLTKNSELGAKETKDMDGKLRRDIEEIEWKIAYLRNVKRKLKNIYAERFGLDGYLLQSFIEQFSSTYTLLHPCIENNHLTFSPLWNQRRGMLGPDDMYESRQGGELQHGTQIGLLAYLFARYATSQGYAKHFLYTYRYCMTSERLLKFITTKYLASVSLNDLNQQTTHQVQVQYRALDLLAEWIDDYFDVDFKHNNSLCLQLRKFLVHEVIPTDKSDRGNLLLEMLEDKEQNNTTCLSLLAQGSNTNASLDDLGNIELSEQRPAMDENLMQKNKPNDVGRKSLLHEFLDYKTSIFDYSDQILAEQLCLIQQDLFHHLHPVHFLNTRSLGVGVSRNPSPSSIASHKDIVLGFSAGIRRESTDSFDLISSETSHPANVGEVNNEIIEDIIEHAQNLSMWVAGEICGMPSTKSQLALITKFINVANYCHDIRNFETAIQILDALETFVVRQLPVWKQVSAKTFEILDELKAVKVLLKTDASWLIQGDAYRRKPTIPSALLFIMHVQQEELGGFLLANGMYKWTKLRSIARLVDQIRAFQELKYNFLPNEDLQRTIKRRITNLKDQNLQLIASENSINFYGPRPSTNSKKLKNALEKMKSSFS